MANPENRAGFTSAPAATGGQNVLVVDDEEVIRGPISLCLETLGYRVTEASTAEEALSAARGTQFDIVLMDVRLGTANGLDVMTRLFALQPRAKVIVITAYASVDIAVTAMARGAVDFLCKPFTPDQLTLTVERAADLRHLESTVGMVSDRFGTAGADADFATTSDALRKAIETARRLAPTDQALLIIGEAGSGKRVLARAIHGWGSKPEEPFAGIDCAAYSAAYVDLAIFGDSIFGNKVITAERPPLIRRSGGTIKLRHVEAMTPASQKRLAKLITTRQCELLDGEKVRVQDIRLIATAGVGSALENELLAAFGDGIVSLPPLRERPYDIPMLAQRYLGYVRDNQNATVMGFSPEAIDALTAYDWPGNLAELRKLVGVLVENAKTPLIEHGDLPETIRQFKKVPGSRPRVGENVSLAALEAAHIRAVVAASPSLRKAAETLGLDFQALYRRRKQYGLE